MPVYAGEVPAAGATTWEDAVSQYPPEQPYGQNPPPPPPGPGPYQQPGQQPYQTPGPQQQQGPYQQPYQQGPGFSGPSAGSSMSPSDERLWGLFAHLSWIVGSIVAIAPLGPLVIFLVFKDRSPFVRRHAVEALNFWITVYIALAISLALMFVLIGFVTFPVVAIAALVFSIIAAVAANRGENYRYPMTLRLIS
jgi:uncharacterized Tic20 family protein